jgi:citrate lyase beta subunit
VTGDELADALDARLAAADEALAATYPGDRGVRQPVHTVYVPAHRYDAGTVRTWGEAARAALEVYGEAEGDVLDRVRRKLDVEPIEDLRIDFEDGYGERPDEDETAVAAARALTASIKAGAAAPFHGIRIKSLEQPTRRRGVRTLQLFLSTLVAEGGLTDGFVVTLPKVTSVDQVEAFAFALARLEDDRDLRPLRFEIQVETPQAVLGADGTALVARMIHAGGGRVTGLHYGTYDYSASLGVSSAQQSLEHPVADHAKAVMQVAAAGTGVFVSDGSSNVLPVGDVEQVRAAWRLHARLVRRSLEHGIYQGWDLHPAQLPTRYLATYAFYRDGLDEATSRLKAYVDGGSSGFLDEPATAAAMAGFLLRAVECGATDEAELDKLVGVDRDRLAIIARRRG